MSLSTEEDRKPQKAADDLFRPTLHSILNERRMDEMKVDRIGSALRNGKFIRPSAAVVRIVRLANASRSRKAAAALARDPVDDEDHRTDG